MQSKTKLLTVFCLVVLGLYVTSCGDDNKPTGRCSVQGVKGTAPSLAGIWLVQDTAHQCKVFGLRRYCGERIDTFGVDGPAFDEVYYRRFWEGSFAYFFTEAPPLIFGCARGSVSDSDIEVSAFGAMGGSDECHPPVDLTTEGSPNDSSWFLHSTLSYLRAGDSCGLAIIGDTVSNCVAYKTVYTKLEDLPE